MNIFSFFSHGKKAIPPKTNKTVALSDRDYEQIIGSFREETRQPSLKLEVIRRSLDVYASKLGGLPYLPPDFSYPYNQNPASDKKPLKLLAQLNFSKLPHLPDFPVDGILQFYLACEKKEACWGLDFDGFSNQSAFRVVYHQNIILDPNQLQSPPEMDAEGLERFPFRGEFALLPQENYSFMNN